MTGAMLPVLLAGLAWGDEFLSNMRKGDKRDHPEERVEYYTRAINSWNNSHGGALLGHCYFRRGEGHYILYQFDRAEADLARAVNLDSRNARAYLLRGKLHLRTSRWDRAARDFQEFEAITGTAEGLWLLGEAYEKSGRYEPALRSLESARSMAPEDFHPPLGMARVLMSQKKNSLALDLLNEADKLAEKDSPEVLSQRGRCKAALGMLAPALQDLKNAIELFERKLGELDRSKSSPVDVVDYRDGLALAHFRRGQVHETQRKLPQAAADYRKACELDLQEACAREDVMARRAPTPEPEPVKPKRKKRYPKAKDDPGERIYAN